MADTISDYILRAHSMGVTKETIRQELIRAGWPEKDVDLALSTTLKDQPTEAGHQQTFILLAAGILILIVFSASTILYFQKDDTIIEEDITIQEIITKTQQAQETPPSPTILPAKVKKTQESLTKFSQGTLTLLKSTHEYESETKVKAVVDKSQEILDAIQSNQTLTIETLKSELESAKRDVVADPQTINQAYATGDISVINNPSVTITNLAVAVSNIAQAAKQLASDIEGGAPTAGIEAENLATLLSATVESMAKFSGSSHIEQLASDLAGASRPAQSWEESRLFENSYWVQIESLFGQLQNSIATLRKGSDPTSQAEYSYDVVSTNEQGDNLPLTDQSGMPLVDQGSLDPTLVPDSDTPVSENLTADISTDSMYQDPMYEGMPEYDPGNTEGYGQLPTEGMYNP